MGSIWQNENWPHFKWDSSVLMKPLGEVRFLQGSFLAKLSDLGFDLSENARADILVEEVLKTSAIEGEHLNLDSVRSSVSIRLGLPDGGLLGPVDRKIDGIVDILLDAAENHGSELTPERLWSWHAALFPTGYSGLVKISVGEWRKDLENPMRVVSGPIGREVVHFEAPPASILETEMVNFLTWFNSQKQLDGIIKAGIAHLWFITIHPFDDGNGRIARALTDLLLALDEKNPKRFYSFSSQIMADRRMYYDILKQSQSGTLDITPWLKWFLASLNNTIKRSESLLSLTMIKARFWNYFAKAGFNERQKKVLNRLLDAGPGGFEGGMKNKKYVGMTCTSRATAQRELALLVEKGALIKLPGKGRSTAYDLNWRQWGDIK